VDGHPTPASHVLLLLPMKSTPFGTLYDWPLSELRRRGQRACGVLRRARAVIGRPGAMQCVDAALDEVEHLLPGLMDRPPTLVDRTVRDLSPDARTALRQAIDAERDARERLARMLGAVPLAEAERALSRVEEQDAVLFELLGLLTLFEKVYCATPDAGAAV
jgi:hypothetical protein